jgi:ribosomal protein L17
MNKLIMQVAPRLRQMNQNYVKMTKIIRRRRGDNAPMVIVSIRGDER